MVPGENKNNAYAEFWRANKEYYGIFESGLLATPFCTRLPKLIDLITVLTAILTVRQSVKYL